MYVCFHIAAQAVVYHFALYEQALVASSQAMRGRNEYTAQYAAAAMSDIRRRLGHHCKIDQVRNNACSRGLDVVVELPDTDPGVLIFAVTGPQQPLFTTDEINKLTSSKKPAIHVVGKPATPIQEDVGLIIPILPTAAHYAATYSSSSGPSIISLPNFARDNSEFLTAAVLERFQDFSKSISV